MTNYLGMNNLPPNTDVYPQQSHFNTVEFREVMERLSQTSCNTYRALIYENPLFVRYFHDITPASVLSGMNLGSRPAKRKVLARPSESDCFCIPNVAILLVHALLPLPTVTVFYQ